MAHLGIQSYRFSISWSRLIPGGEGEVNEEGAAFYSELIDALLEHGITPWVCLCHWDIPLALEQDFGGWLGPKARVQEAFGAYARVCFRRFGQRVKHWITINEPWGAAVLGYLFGEIAPGRSGAGGSEPYLAAHNMLLAHAEAVRIYRCEFLEDQQGQLGLTLSTNWHRPSDATSPQDQQAAQAAMDFWLGWFADPIYFGDYPARMRAICGSRLPEFSEEESALLKGSADFFGINNYSTNLVRAPPASRALRALLRLYETATVGPGFVADVGRTGFAKDDESWERTDMGWAIVPWGLRDLLLYLQRRYAPPGGIYVTENGAALEPSLSEDLDDQPGALEPRPGLFDEGSSAEDFAEATFDDPQRVRFLRAHLAAVHEAVLGGADVRGYFVWSLLDNFEWTYGYTRRFGLVRVDFETQERTVKSSGRFLAAAIRRRGIRSPPKRELYAGTVF